LFAVDFDSCEKGNDRQLSNSRRGEMGGNESEPRTKPVSSPGKAANRSPTWTIPLSILPDTANPDAVADCPLKTFETGILKGLSSDRVGTCNVSIY
jgi:hypothetical protein